MAVLNIKRLILVLILLFCIPSISRADISFTNGLWTQDFASGNCTPNYVSFGTAYTATTTNGDCRANHVPYDCCTGNKTGNCTNTWSCGGIDTPSYQGFDNSGAVANCDYAHATRVTTGTSTGGLTTKLIDTATNFVTAGVVAGQVMGFSQGGNIYGGVITSISTTTNANDTLNYPNLGTAPTAGDPYYVYYCNNPPTLIPAEITPDASRTGAVGDAGFRERRGPSLNCGAAPVNGGGCRPDSNAYGSGDDGARLTIKFPTPYPKEFWLRYYTRLESGSTWDVSPFDTKQLFLLGKIDSVNKSIACTGAGTPCSLCTGFAAGNCTNTASVGPIFNFGKQLFGLYSAKSPSSITLSPNYGWDLIYASNGGISDGSWALIEYHFKMNTPNLSDGVFDFWLNGNNLIDNTSMRFTDPDECAVPGWDHFIIPHNGGYWSGIVGGQQHAGYQDFDDMAVADTTYTGFVKDAQGRNMIGPIGMSPPFPSPPSPPPGSPPVMSSGLPTGNYTYPSGSTSVPMQLVTNINANCKYGTSDVAYSSMANTFATGQGTASHSQNITTSNGKSYTYYVRCDTVAGGNPDTSSLVLSWNVAAGPSGSPPVMSSGVPTGNYTYPSGTTSVPMQLVTNNNANCKYGTSDVAYSSMANTFSTGQGTTSHSQTITTSNRKSYTYYVRCDTAAGGNPDTSSLVLSWNVAAGAGDTTAPAAPQHLLRVVP